VYLKSKSNIDLTDFNFLLGSPELEDPMQIDPSSQARVYLSCDSLYWINDGDCHRYPLDHLPTGVTVQHVIVSEFWIRREVMHAQPDRHRLCRPGFDYFDFVEQDEKFQMCASVRTRAFDLLSTIVDYDALESVTPESDWVCQQKGEGVFAWYCESTTTACLVSDGDVTRVGFWLTSQSDDQLSAWIGRIGSVRPIVRLITPKDLLLGQALC